MKTFFTADTHFGHRRIRDFCNRPFSSVEEMNDAITDNWNRSVSDKDEIYIVGDFSWDDPDRHLKRLNGRKILIRSGHDFKWKKRFTSFDEVYDAITLLKFDPPIILSHCCFRVWERSHFNSWHLFGHSHGRLEPVGKSWDVGVDVNSYKPLSYEEIQSIMCRRPDNVNFLGTKKAMDLCFL